METVSCNIIYCMYICKVGSFGVSLSIHYQSRFMVLCGMFTEGFKRDDLGQPGKGQ